MAGRFSFLARLAAAGLAIASTQPASAATLESLSLEFSRIALSSKLQSAFYKQAEALSFFGDAGPDAGCDAIKRLVREIAGQEAVAFRPEHLAVLARGFPPERLANVPDGALEATLFGFSLVSVWKTGPGGSPTLTRSLETLNRRASEWLKTEGYAGRRLGYDRADRPFWRGDGSSLGLICANQPHDRPQLWGDWDKP